MFCLPISGTAQSSRPCFPNLCCCLYGHLLGGTSRKCRKICPYLNCFFLLLFFKAFTCLLQYNSDGSQMNARSQPTRRPLDNKRLQQHYQRVIDALELKTEEAMIGTCTLMKDETLCLTYYLQKGKPLSHFAEMELISRSWMLHKKRDLWYKAVGTVQSHGTGTMGQFIFYNPNNMKMVPTPPRFHFPYKYNEKPKSEKHLPS